MAAETHTAAANKLTMKWFNEPDNEKRRGSVASLRSPSIALIGAGSSTALAKPI
jgi:hypothetical protein